MKLRLAGTERIQCILSFMENAGVERPSLLSMLAQPIHLCRRVHPIQSLRQVERAGSWLGDAFARRLLGVVGRWL